MIRAILYRIGSKNTKTICLSSSSLIQKCAIYDHDNLKTCLVFSTAGDNRDENCLKLDSTDSSKCAKCLPGWTLANDHLTCVYTGDNCKEFDETKTPPKCISC